MRRLLHISPRADRDLDEQIDYLAERSVDIALRFLQAVQDTFKQIAEMPEIGNPQKFRNRRLAGMRRWPVQGFKDYLVFYQASKDEVAIVRVLHGARDIESIFASDGPKDHRS